MSVTLERPNGVLHIPDLQHVHRHAAVVRSGEVCAGFDVWERCLHIGNVFQVSWIRQASRYRAMLMYRVLAGKAKSLTTADHNLVAAPAGFDSVRGVPGGGLNYDELIFYDDNQI